MTKQRRFSWVIACWLVLALVPGAAFALGLGPIEVRSPRNAPLLAEIRIISSDPSELDDLRARLASPDTFARVGLAPPQGLVSNLQFAVALDAAGEPVIRVTSAEPVQQSLLTFLVEVDWGQGRLVREYSALIDTPDAVAATAQPPIQAPVAPTTDAIIRPAQAPLPVPSDPAPAPLAGDTADAAEDAPSTAIAPTPVVPTPPTPTPAPSPAPVAPRVADTAPAADPGEYGPVQAGDTLGRIAADVRASDETLDQAMVAILRANPQAFIGDNLNLLRQGAVLRIPPPQARAEYSAAEATAVVREQVAQWRAMRTPAPLPEAVADGASTATAAATPAAAGPAAPRVADARLEITPPAPGGSNQAGTRSGIQAGGEGDMLRQEMQQTAETLAAREAEVQELKARVADLERLQAQQQQLIGLKDSELAAAQARLAESNAQASSPVAGADGAAPAESGAGLAWLWIGLALVAAAVVGWLLLRRRDAGVARRPFDTATLAASVPSAAASSPVPPVADRATPEPAVRDRGDAPVDADPAPPASGFTAAPSWNAPGLQSVERAPTWHAGEAAGGDRDSATVAPLNASPGGHERIELARAYVDLGDLDTARSLLQEVAAGDDPASREEAAQLLRELA